MKSYLNEAMRYQKPTKFSASSRAAIEKYAKIVPLAEVYLPDKLFYISAQI